MFKKKTDPSLNLTTKQAQAIGLVRSKALHILLYGGARSGKTVAFLLAILYRAMEYPGSRHLIARWRYSHAKTSIWRESLLPMLKNHAPGQYRLYESDPVHVEFANGSEIWVGGFDDKERVEKLLGHEYATIMFNEVSQIGFDAVTLGMSRLAQTVKGLVNKAYYDCNPPSPLHWAHKLFIEKIDPVSGDRLKQPDLYRHLRMNPFDNEANLPKNYIRDILGALPDRARRRMRDGEWVRAEGVIYEHFQDSMIIPYDELPPMEYYSIGVDFGLNMAAVLWGWCGECLYLIDDHGAYNATSSTFDAQINARFTFAPGGNLLPSNVARYCDPSGGERIQEITNGEPANNAVDDGIDFINTKMEHGEFFATERATGFLSEIQNYKRDEKERIVKIDDHYMDAARYGAYSFQKPARLGKQEQKRQPVAAGMRDMRF